jgi:phage tail-like protein
MAIQRDTPYSGINFIVELGIEDPDSPHDGLLEVIFPEAHIQVQEYRRGNERANDVRKLSTTTKYGNLILKRSAIGSLTWYFWWDLMRNGNQAAVRNIIVQLLNEDHSNVVLTWKFLRARPVNHQFSPLNAIATEPLIETLEVAFDRLEME